MHNKIKTLLSVIALVCVAVACTPKKKKQMPVDQSDESTSVLTYPKDWVDGRVDQAKKRLEGSEASQLVWESIEAHGGLKKWYNNGVLSFQFNYMPLKNGMQRDSYQWIDTWSARATHHLATDTKVKFGWDGKKAWTNDTTLKINARFWSLTPYYFVGVPFVLADEGIKYELLEDEIIESAIHKRVKITFEEGVGDAPDDYYILYIDEQTKYVDALIYIVSYPDFFPDGGHSEEKFMDYIGQQTVDGIVLAESYKTYLRKGKKGFVNHVTDIALTDVKFNQELPVNYFDAPPSATVVQ